MPATSSYGSIGRRAMPRRRKSAILDRREPLGARSPGRIVSPAAFLRIEGSPSRATGLPRLHPPSHRPGDLAQAASTSCTMPWIPHVMVVDDDPRVLDSLFP